MIDDEKIKLTEDPLTNIRIMLPLLSDQAKEAMSYFMYGCYVGESFVRNKQNDIK